MKQLSLIEKPSLEFGGALDIDFKKEIRTLSGKYLTHLVLKSTGKRSLFHHRKFIRQTIFRQAELSGVKVFGLSVQDDHIHHALQYPSRQAYNRFVRAVTGLVARKLGRGIWKYRPYSRVLTSWGKPAQNLRAYIEKNELEIWGVIPYRRD